MRTVIFDLDGTLANTSGDLIAAANACFLRRGWGALLDPEADAACAFQGGRAMLRLGLDRRGVAWDEAEIDSEFPYLLEYYGNNIDRYTTLYPGVDGALDRLATAGYRLGICTNKPEALADVLMSRLGLRDRFGALVGADTFPVRKPDPRPYREAVTRAGGEIPRSLLVGDTVTDRETARAAGVPSVLVTFGPDGNAVQALDPEGLLDHYDALHTVVERLID